MATTVDQALDLMKTLDPADDRPPRQLRVTSPGPVRGPARAQRGARHVSSDRPAAPQVPRIGAARPVLAVVESVALEAPADPYLTLRGIAEYASCSVRWLRDRLADPDHPLPHYRLPGGKILVRRSAFDAWVNAYRQEGTAFMADVDRLVAKFSR